MRRDFGACDLGWGEGYNAAANHLAGLERRGQDRRSGDTAVDVGNPPDVVDVGQGAEVARVSQVGSVYVAHVALAVVIPREVGLARAKWKPRLHARAADDDEGHKRRRVAWPPHDGPRKPAPRRSDEHPSTVVERRVPPRLVLDPGPPPRVDPHPVAEAVRHPADRHAGIPHGPIVRLHLPAARVVKLVIAGYLGAHVLGRRGRRDMAVALGTPRIEGVARGPLHLGHLERVGAAELDRGPGADGLCHAAPTHLSAAAVHHQHRGAVGRVDVDPVGAHVEQVEHAVWCVDLDRIARQQLAHADADGASRDTELQDLVVQIGDGDVGVCGEAHGDRADLELGAAHFADVESIAVRHGVV